MTNDDGMRFNLQTHSSSASIICDSPMYSEESLDSATRDAVTMSWKYAAMEIYGLLSDVRDTDAVEMNVSS